ncbi:MAG: hypothetical protein EA421_12805 [Gemmatimonadales bacterium]|nr:MAG: hypothetical protein EA421_12805 [Gemmatimonadales bacterium]
MKIFPRRFLFAASLALAVLILSLAPEALEAQAAGPRMRDFWHVFIAYALAWALLFGWVVAIFRRLGRLTEKLDAG